MPPVNRAHLRARLEKQMEAARQLRAETLARLCSSLLAGGRRLIRLMTAGAPRGA